MAGEPVKASSTENGLGGLIVRARRVEGAPVVAIRAWLPGGARSEPRPGVALMTGRLLAEGSRSRDWRRIVTEAEAIGMSVGGGATIDGHGVSVDGLAADWQRGLAWAAELTREAGFPTGRHELVQVQMGAELRSFEDRPEVKVGLAFLNQLYHPHPMGRPLQGDELSLAQLSPQDCMEFHQQRMEQGLVVTVAGDIEPDLVKKEAEALWNSLSSSSPLAGRVTSDGPNGPDGIAPALSAGRLRRTVALLGQEQAHLYLGHRTVRLAHPDFPALHLLGVILGSGAGLVGRIPQQVREERGLAYAAHATAVAGAGLDDGRLAIYVGTSPQTAHLAEDVVRGELERLLADGVSAAEIDSARAYLLGREPFRRETARQWADLLSDATILGVPVDHPDWLRSVIQELTPADLLAAAGRHISLECLCVTLGVP